MTMVRMNRRQGKQMAILAVAALALVFAPFQAWASPIVGPPTPISSSGGSMTVVYAFADADDASLLAETVPNSIPVIFCNHPTPGCAVPSISGDTLPLGPTAAGPLVFTLQDFTAPALFDTTNANGIDGDAHDLVSATVFANDAAAVAAAFAIYGVGPISPAAAASIAALGLLDPLTTMTFIGWEDRINGDYDYNDLIFGFTNIVQVPRVPEPATLFLLGAGIAGVAGLGRMRLRRNGTK